jgi:hypothetical protein
MVLKSRTPSSLDLPAPRMLAIPRPGLSAREAVTLISEHAGDALRRLIVHVSVAATANAKMSALRRHAAMYAR